MKRFVYALAIVAVAALGGGCVSGKLDINTGRAWTPERYHDELVDIQKDTDRLEENIRALENRDI